jgi:hypothetical protein
LADLAAHAPSLYQHLAAYAPSMYELWGRFGRQRRRHRAARVAQSAAWFGAGIAVGSGLATMLTPNSEMRRRLTTSARRMREYLAPGNGSAAEHEELR